MNDTERGKNIYLWLRFKSVCIYAQDRCPVSTNHRYLKKSRLLKFCYVLATSTASSKGIFAGAFNSTHQTNMAGGTCH
jgi:hypothetical protein